MKGSEPIYIVDCIVPLAGRRREVHRHYLDVYAPTARARGLDLCHSWVSPPVWLEGDQANTLYFVWSVKGTAAYWNAEGLARWDPEGPAFWRGLEAMIQSRTRQVMAEHSDVEGLCDV